MNIAELFLASALRYPERPCLEVRGNTYSYLQLALQASRVSQLLSSIHKPGALVGILASRSARAYEGILGALLGGSGYVPLHLDWPARRILTALERADVETLVVGEEGLESARRALASTGRPLNVIVPDQEWLPQTATPHRFFSLPLDSAASRIADAADCSGETIAYVIFTSGSSATPKGVAVSQGNLAASWKNLTSVWRPRETDRCSQFIDLVFDPSVLDLFVPWSAGACVCALPSDCLLDPSEFIRENELTTWVSVPSVAIAMKKLGKLLPNRFPRLRMTLFGGEALSAGLVQAWQEAAPRSRIINAYGPTECTVQISTYEWRPLHSPGQCLNGVVPIGQFFEDVEVCLLDDSDNPNSYIDEGELCVRGKQVVRGYLRDPERTKAHFLRLPGQGNEHWYRTGDRIRRVGPETWAFLGRLDDQVKISGYRIELQEVEHVLRSVPGVVEAAAVAWPLTEGHAEGIVGFLCATTDLDRAAIKRTCAASLPFYMIPRHLVFADKLPLTENGKINRGRLLSGLENRKYDLEALIESSPDKGPQSAEEAQVISVWRKLLNVDIGRNGNFFELGGDSLLAVDASMALNELGEPFSRTTVAHIYRHATPAALAAVLLEERSTAAVPGDPDEPGWATLLTAEESRTFREHFGFEAASPIASSALQQASVVDVFGLSRPQKHELSCSTLLPHPFPTIFTAFRFSRPLSAEAMERALVQTCNAFPTVRTAFAGADPDSAIQVVYDSVTSTLKLTKSALRRPEPQGVEEFWKTPMDLSRPPLVRTGMWKLGEGFTEVHIAYHHAIEDFYMASMFETDLFRAYRALEEGKEMPPKAYPPYRHYVEFDRREAELEPCRQHLETLLKGFDWSAWREKIPGTFSALSREHLSRRVALEREGRFSQGIYAHAAWGLVVGALTGSADTLFCCVVSDRYLGPSPIPQAPGPMNRGVPCRVDFSSEKPVGQLLEELHKQLVRSTSGARAAADITIPLLTKDALWSAFAYNVLPSGVALDLPEELSLVEMEVRIYASDCPLLGVVSSRRGVDEFLVNYDPEFLGPSRSRWLSELYVRALRTLPRRLTDPARVVFEALTQEFKSRADGP